MWCAKHSATMSSMFSMSHPNRKSQVMAISSRTEWPDQQNKKEYIRVLCFNRKNHMGRKLKETTGRMLN